MNNQGFFGALYQYWDIHEKPRLDRRNTFFDDSLDKVSNYDALIFAIFCIVIGLAVISSWCIISAIIGMVL